MKKVKIIQLKIVFFTAVKNRCILHGRVFVMLCGFCLERFPLPLGAWDGLRYFIMALTEPSI